MAAPAVSAASTPGASWSRASTMREPPAAANTATSTPSPREPPTRWTSGSSSPARWLAQDVVACIHGRLRPVAQTETSQNVGDAVFYGRFADEQCGGDFAIRGLRCLPDAGLPVRAPSAPGLADLRALQAKLGAAQASRPASTQSSGPAGRCGAGPPKSPGRVPPPGGLSEDTRSHQLATPQEHRYRHRTWFGSLPLLVYAGAIGIGCHVFVVGYEEPAVHRRLATRTTTIDAPSRGGSRVHHHGSNPGRSAHEQDSC
jgi:hypothetical protein